LCQTFSSLPTAPRDHCSDLAGRLADDSSADPLRRLIDRAATLINLAPASARPAAPASGKPGLFDKTNGLVLLSLGLAATLSSRFERDRRIQSSLDRSGLDAAIDFGDRYGSGATLGLTALGFMAIGRSTRNQRFSQAGVELSSALLAAAGIAWAMKIAFNRERPNGGPYSFPSGHTSTAFAAAPVLHRNFGDFIGYTAYGIAALTGAARLEDNKHYMTDVLAGAILGIVAGRTLSYQSPVRFTVPKGGLGLGVSYKFN
jgi:membrane-associated phospholipid phosphatase